MTVSSVQNQRYVCNCPRATQELFDNARGKTSERVSGSSCWAATGRGVRVRRAVVVGGCGSVVSIASTYRVAFEACVAAFTLCQTKYNS